MEIIYYESVQVPTLEDSIPEKTEYELRMGLISLIKENEGEKKRFSLVSNFIFGIRFGVSVGPLYKISTYLHFFDC